MPPKFKFKFHEKDVHGPWLDVLILSGYLQLPLRSSYNKCCTSAPLTIGIFAVDHFFVNLGRQGPLTGKMGCSDLAISSQANHIQNNSKPHVKGLLNGHMPQNICHKRKEYLGSKVS